MKKSPAAKPIRTGKRDPEVQGPLDAAPPSNGQPSPLAAVLQAAVNLEAPPPHIEVQALAGTGKTITVIEGCKVIKGKGSALTPSPQQQAVWDALAAGSHGSIRVSSFASKITAELKVRLDAAGLDSMGVEACGIHSLGNRAVTKRFGRCSPDKSKWVVPDIVCGILGTDLKSIKGKPLADVVWAVDALVSLCKQTLTEPIPGGLDALASRYDIDLNGSKDRVYSLVPEALELCKQPQQGRITFDDMLWLPIVHDLPIYKVDLQIIDEVQDLNRAQQELMLRAGRRILFVGDRHQAIFGFAGADSESMGRMRQTLDAATLPLTVTRRCGKAIVEEARRWVPEYQAHESNPEGLVTHAGYEENRPNQYRKLAQPGDFVLCRCNAPLVSQCFRFIKGGRKATILGKQIGQGLKALVEKSKAQTAPDLIAWLGDWLAKETANENAKRYPGEGRIENLQDRHDCVLAFCEGQSEVDGVLAKIDQVFTDSKDDRGIVLSSIHKAKGLEARNVFLLRPQGCGPRRDKMQAWELEQEDNLAYVAVTRAIETLTYVS